MQGFPVTLEFPLHWGEMDALGHVNNIRYFAWFESARLAYFTRMGLRLDPDLQIGPILASTSCDFLKAVTFPAKLVAGARVEKIGNTSVQMVYAVARAETPDEPCARGKGAVVFVNYHSGEKVPLSAELRARIEAIERGEP